MDPALRIAAAEVIATATGERSAIRTATGVGGGCINDARVVELEDGRQFLVKSNPRPLPGMFDREADGLRALGESGAVRTASAVGTGTDPIPFIVLGFISTGSRAADFSEQFGRGLAELHRTATSSRFGFARDNYLGATSQPNRWHDDWVEFWRERRLGHQLELARGNGFGGELQTLGERMMDSLAALIADPEEPPCLLHGDLWGGNYMIGATGHAILIDPAAYYGRREADLAMTMLFGGFDERFYAAYREAWPLAAGSDERLAIYELYHRLNHLNLFGASYLGGCMQTLRRFS